jgi:formate dehydrogenase assembly factor FdhD
LPVRDASASASASAVMGATPCHVQALAVGFSLTKGIIGSIAKADRFEKVQKPAMIDAQATAAISAPTRLAVQVAEQGEISLAGIAGDDGLTLFSHAQRLKAIGCLPRPPPTLREHDQHDGADNVGGR